MAIGGAFLGGGVEVVPAGSCKLELEILTEDRANLTATFTIKGTSTYTVTAGADGRAVYTVPAGQTYTVSVNTTGYDNIASQTVIAESGTVRYVRFEAFAGRVKRSGDTMTGNLAINMDMPRLYMGISKEGNYGDIIFSGADGNRAALIRGVDGVGSNELILATTHPTTGTLNFGLKINYDSNNLLNVTAPSWSPGTNDNSDKIMTIKMANSLPSLVHTTGNESIAGAKSFSDNMTIPSSTYKSSTQPTPFIDFYYNNGDSFATRLIQLDTDFRIVNTLPVTLSSETPSDATGTEIVTADWSLSKFQRKITYGTGDPPSGGQAGDIYIKI